MTTTLKYSALISTALVALLSGAAAHADDAVLSGVSFMDVSNISNTVNGVKSGTTNGTGVDVKRFYIGIDKKFNDIYSANVTTDFQYNSGLSATELFIKKAYFQANFNPAFVVSVGSNSLPWAPYAESVEGYRYIENTLADRTKFASTTDWGVHATGVFANNFAYAVSAINGNGYKNPTRAKTVDLEARLSAKFGPFSLGLGAYDGDRGTAFGTTTFHTATRADGLAAYSNDVFRVGVEYFSAHNWNNVTTVATDQSKGTSLFSSYHVTPIVALFGKLEQVTPNSDTAPTKKETYYNMGLQYSALKNIDLSLVFKHDGVDNGTLATSNGTIGGSIKGTYDEVGLFGQFKY